jgi:hypothetical protein
MALESLAKNGVIVAMKRKLSRIPLVLGMSGLLAAGLAATAATASAAPAPSWHKVLIAPGPAIGTVVATGKTSAWAFSETGQVAYERTGATTWKKVAFASSGVDASAAAASSPSDVWAIGVGDQLFHWNGRKWSAASGAPGAINAISALSPRDVWVFCGKGESTLAGAYHFNGRKWTRVAAALSGGYAVSDSNVWAYNGETVAHFNGRKWTTTSVAKLFPPSGGLHVPPGLNGILALGPDNVYAVGEGWQGEGGGAAVVLHFNGRSWSRVAAGPAVVNFGESLASDGKGGLWIVTDTHQNDQYLYRYSAGKLTKVTLPVGVGPLSVSRIPGTAGALIGGFQLGTTENAVVEQYS